MSDEDVVSLTKEEVKMIAFVRRRNEDGTPCSADREVIAQQLERGMHRS